MTDSLWPVNVGDMVSLDSSNVLSCGKPGKRNEDVIRQRDNIAMSVYESGLALLLFRIHDWHKQRWLHVNGTMEMEYRGQLVVDCLVQRSVVWRFSILIVDESTRRSWRLFEQRCKGSLLMRRIRLGYEMSKPSDRIDRGRDGQTHTSTLKHS